MAAGLMLLWVSGGPRVVGQLPREDLRTICGMFNRNTSAGLVTALRRVSSDALADWIADRRDGQLVLVKVQNLDQVLAFVTTSMPGQGRMLTIDRSTNGWKISGTNNSVRFH